MFSRVSLLESEGHPEATEYPLWFLAYEASTARERINNRLRTEAVLTQQAYSGSKSKKALKEFNKTLEKLDER